jgi:hypothetical protein
MGWMSDVSGSLSIVCRDLFYAIHFSQNGWVAGEMLQYLDDVYRAESLEVGILKMLGYTMEVSRAHPPRTAVHWVELDLNRKVLATNSELVRKAVRKEKPNGAEPYWPPALDRIYTVLDNHDFTVELYS